MAYSIVSLFSGAGFLDFGFTENGFDILWGCELVPWFAHAHNYNLQLRYDAGKAHIVQIADITQVSVRDIPTARGIIGGPPCQDFSIGNASNPGVKGVRGQLVWDYLKKVSELNPDFFLFENVEGLYKTKRHREEALLPLIAEFTDLGYEVDFRVLNALEYGVPQDRSRVFIVAFKRKMMDALREHGFSGFSWPVAEFPSAKNTYDWPSIWEYGTTVDERSYLDSSDLPPALTVYDAIMTDSMDSLPNHVSFRPYSSKFTEIAEGDDRRKSFKRLHRFRYSPTVAYGNNEVHLHPAEPRRISVREALRLQSLPDWYQFEESTPLDKMFKMISNGVPFKLASLLAIEIRRVLEAYDSITTQTSILETVSH